MYEVFRGQRLCVSSRPVHDEILFIGFYILLYHADNWHSPDRYNMPLDSSRWERVSQKPITKLTILYKYPC